MKPAAIISWLHRPLVAPIARQTALALALGIAGVIQVLAALFNLPLIPCPLLHATNIPCPGCGISRACAALLRGKWSQSMRLHALAIFFLIAIPLLLFAALLPPRSRTLYCDRLEKFERATGITRLLLIATFLYWLGRLLYDPIGFSRLMRTPN